MARCSLTIPDQIPQNQQVSPKAIYSFLYLMRSLNLSDFVEYFCKEIYVQKLKCLIPLGPGQSVYLVWKASEEAHLAISTCPPSTLSGPVIFLLSL